MRDLRIPTADTYHRSKALEQESRNWTPEREDTEDATTEMTQPNEFPSDETSDFGFPILDLETGRT
jgi:hypothetical protein